LQGVTSQSYWARVTLWWINVFPPFFAQSDRNSSARINQ
jgi:hypothetical protein